MAISKVVQFDPYKSIAFGSISGSFTAIGTPFSHASHLMKIVNTCNTAMIISFNGVDNHDLIPAGGFALYDFTTNGGASWSFAFSKGTQAWVKQLSAPASGNVYLMSIYAKGE